VAQKMESDGYQRVIVIAPDGNWGQSISASFGKAWLALGGQIVNSAAYQKAQDFTDQAQTLSDADSGSDASPKTAIFLVANAQDARVLVPMLRHQPTPPVIYGLPMIYSGVPNAALNATLNGVFFPSTMWQLDSQSPARQRYANLYPDASEDALRLYGFGMDAFSLSQYYLKQHSFAGVNLAGYSGQLSLVDGVIERQLVWAHFDAGLAVKA
jgi:outer membrane PBP1 activator LpoA protein